MSVWCSGCSVLLAPAHRGVGASTGSLWLAQTRLTPFWKTAVWRHNLFFFLVVFRRYPDRKHPGFKDTLSHSLFPTTTSPHPPASVSARFGVLRFCPTARKLTRGSMVLNFHCNKWITGGDPTKVSGGFFFFFYVCGGKKLLFFLQRWIYVLKNGSYSL